MTNLLLEVQRIEEMVTNAPGIGWSAAARKAALEKRRAHMKHAEVDQKALLGVKAPEIKGSMTPPPAGKKPDVMGHTPAEFARWMGKQGHSFDAAKKVMVHHGVDMKDATLKTYLSDGKSGKYGKAAAVSEGDAAKVKLIQEGLIKPPAPKTPTGSDGFIEHPPAVGKKEFAPPPAPTPSPAPAPKAPDQKSIYTPKKFDKPGDAVAWMQTPEGQAAIARKAQAVQELKDSASEAESMGNRKEAADLRDKMYNEMGRPPSDFHIEGATPTPSKAAAQATAKSWRDIQAGHHVEFMARGKKVTGTVLQVRVSQRRGKARDIAARVTGDPHALDREVAKVMSDDGKSVWTVGLMSLKPTGKMTDTRTAAHAAGDIMRSRKDQEEARRSSAYQAADSAGLYSLKHGDTVETQFRDIGWQKVKFLGFVEGSGNVRFEHRGRIRTGSPKFFRIPKPTA